jgi:GNAT superfamily N-acetyltransferase
LTAERKFVELTVKGTMDTAKAIDWHVNCELCAPAKCAKDGEGNIIHLANRDQLEWNLGEAKKARTRDSNVELLLKVATKDDVALLVSSPGVFPQAKPDSPEIYHTINAYTKLRGQSYPYICFAVADGQVAGKLYVERQIHNAVKPQLRPAIIDGVVVDPRWEGQGVANALLDFAENLVEINGGRWIEIGAMEDDDNSDVAHKRRGMDSLSLYTRRGYHKHAAYVTKALDIHYQVDTIPNIATIVAQRYGVAAIVYKDLKSTFQPSEKKRMEFHRHLVDGLPENRVG